MVRNLLLIIAFFASFSLLILLRHKGSLSEFEYLDFFKILLIAQGILFGIALIIALVRHFMIRSLNPQKATFKHYLRRLFKAQLWIYTPFFLLFLVKTMYALIETYNQEERHNSMTLEFVDDTIDITAITNGKNLDSILQTFSNKDEGHIKTNIETIKNTYPLFTDSVFRTYGDSLRSESSIVVSYIHVEIDPIKWDEKDFGVEITYDYSYKNNATTHMILHQWEDTCYITKHHLGKHNWEEDYKDIGFDREQPPLKPRLIDTTVVNEIKSKYDTLFIEYPKRGDFWIIEDYYTYDRDTTLSRLLYDSLGNINGILRTKNGQRFYTAEYYDNGQQKGPLFTGGSVLDSFYGVYYHRNGRIRSEGVLNRGRHNGVWYNYDTSGKLIVIKIYDEDGHFLGRKIEISGEILTW